MKSLSKSLFMRFLVLLVIVVPSSARLMQSDAWAKGVAGDKTPQILCENEARDASDASDASDAVEIIDEEITYFV